MEDVVEHYLRSSAAVEAHFDFPAPAGPVLAQAISLRVEAPSGVPLPEIPMGGEWQARITFTVHRPIEGFVIALGVSTLMDLPIRTTWSPPRDMAPGTYTATFRNDGIHLADGRYKLVVGLSHQGRTIQYFPEVASISISDVSELTGEARILNTKSGLLINPMEVDIQPVP